MSQIAKSFTVTIDIADEESVRVCEVLERTGDLATLVSLLVDLEIPKYASGEAFQSTPQATEVAHTETKESIDTIKNVVAGLRNLLFDIKEVSEEIKDKVYTDSTPLNIEESLVGALEQYGVTKKKDLDGLSVGVLPVSSGTVINEVASTMDKSVDAEEPVVRKEAKKSVGSKSMASKLKNLKNLKGGS